MHWMIGLHAALGEIGSFSYLWVFVELLNPTPTRLWRAKWVSLNGLILLLLSWIVGGKYYLSHYAAAVKPVIISGAYPWGHTIFMEAKEHIFLFLPFIAFFVFTAVSDLNQKISDDKKTRTGILIAAAFLFFVGMSMAGMGYTITSAFRTSIEMRLAK